MEKNMDNKCTLFKEIPLENYFVENEPYYIPVGNEVEIFMAAYKNLLPVF
jgi:nitric oxide reductase NorQ protein